MRRCPAGTSVKSTCQESSNNNSNNMKRFNLQIEHKIVVVLLLNAVMKSNYVRML